MEDRVMSKKEMEERLLDIKLFQESLQKQYAQYTTEAMGLRKLLLDLVELDRHIALNSVSNGEVLDAQ